MRARWTLLVVLVACSPFSTSNPVADAGPPAPPLDAGEDVAEAGVIEASDATRPCVCPSAPEGWVCWIQNCHLYQAVKLPATISRSDAQIAASALIPNGHLVTLTSAQENDFVRSLLSDATTAWWIGAIQAPSQTKPDQGWSWLQTGEAWDYTNWKVNEPDDGDGTEDGQEDSIFFRADGFWIDDISTGGKEFGYVAEVE